MLPTSSGNAFRGFSAASYLKTTLRLGGSVVPKRDPNSPGNVFFKKVGNRRLVQFVDKFKFLKSKRGRSVAVTGVLAGTGSLPFCFSAFVRVC